MRLLHVRQDTQQIDQGLEQDKTQHTKIALTSLMDTASVQKLRDWLSSTMVARQNCDNLLRALPAGGYFIYLMSKKTKFTRPCFFSLRQYTVPVWADTQQSCAFWFLAHVV